MRKLSPDWEPRGINEFKLRFGDSVSPGIKWEAEVTSEVAGEIAFVQLVQVYAEEIHPSISPNKRIKSSDFAYVLDTSFPYQSHTLLRPNIKGKAFDDDSPDHPIDEKTYILRQDMFQTYLIFQPTGGIYVTLARLDWFWMAEAEKDASGNWTITSSNAYVSASYDYSGVVVYNDNQKFLTWDIN